MVKLLYTLEDQKIFMNDDWRYSDDRMELRQKVYSLLLARFGSALDENGEPVYSMNSITQCSHDWVSQGNVRSDGIVKYFQAYYT
jgi:hypothetical protein